MDAFGQNDQGDFDQYSVVGVDFGADYGEDYGIEPTDLSGEFIMHRNYNQMGYHPSQQLGHVTYVPEMGGLMDDLKMKYAMMPPMQKYALLAAAALGALVALRKTKVIKKKLPLIG